MIRKIKSINNLAVFNGFNWDKSVCNSDGEVREFKQTNILYGRNYSGKTTLSRIFRAMETGIISDKYEAPEFCVVFDDGTEINQENLLSHGKKFRVFNEDFIRENLKFIVDDKEGVESFAILGESNNVIEEEIKKIESLLGIDTTGLETGLFAKRNELLVLYREAKSAHSVANDALQNQLNSKATDRRVGIKYSSDLYGDQNYTKAKLEVDIRKVSKDDFIPITNEEKQEKLLLISERVKPDIPEIKSPVFGLSAFSQAAKVLVARPVMASDKIEQLVKNSQLNRWVNEGRALHRGKHQNCAFCGGDIENSRWDELDRHFDIESENLERDIDKLIAEIEREKGRLSRSLNINPALFYAEFQANLKVLEVKLKEVSAAYDEELDALLRQLVARKNDIIHPGEFVSSHDSSDEISALFVQYETIRMNSNLRAGTLSASQVKAREDLRLREVYDFLRVINYDDQLIDIEKKKIALDLALSEGQKVKQAIEGKKNEIESLKSQLNDEEKGALKVNEYLNDFFGHDFLKLLPVKSDSDSDVKTIKFEVVRDGKKAYHLSEGECSLLAFCYFLARLEDIYTKNSKPIIWIDDPISSLDGNHIYFVYSLISAKICKENKFLQLFISTHNLEFLKFLKRLPGVNYQPGITDRKLHVRHLLVERSGKHSSIRDHLIN